jgi:CHASE3 domain sensor protein
MEAALSSATPAAKRQWLLQCWWLGRSVRAKGLIVVAVPLAALVTVTSASLVLQYSERQERASGRAASALTSSAGQVMIDGINAETGVRGYAVTSDPLFLDPYNRALKRIAADQGKLRSAALPEGDVRQQRVIAATAAKAFAELAQIRAAAGGSLRCSLQRTGSPPESRR